jgi:exonuclease III
MTLKCQPVWTKPLRRAAKPHRVMPDYRIKNLILFFVFSLVCANSSRNSRLDSYNYTGMQTNSWEGLTFSSINCNSLNMSSSGKHNQVLKVYGITKLRTDIIFLSDIRICSRNRVSCSADIKKQFLNNPYGAYNFYFNSSMNKRGVGILVKNNVDFSVTGTRADPEENYLLLGAVMSGKPVTIGSIYGLNNTDDNFFRNLQRDIQSLGNNDVVLAGDWNCTYFTDLVGRNLDCVNMISLPNERHSRLLREMCYSLSLSDPYRCLYPNNTDYTYIPLSADRKNRSRIDFFVVSNTLLNEHFNSRILPSLQCKMFDHRACTFEFLKKQKFEGNTIRLNKNIFNDDIIDYIVHAATAEAFLQHASDRALPFVRKQLELRKVGRIKQLIRLAGPPHVPGEHLIADNGREWLVRRKQLLRNIDEVADDIDLIALADLELEPEPDVFFETLMGMIKNDLFGYQVHASRAKKKMFNEINAEVVSLKSAQNPDLDKIFVLEFKLDSIAEEDLKNELRNTGNFDIFHEEKITPYFVKMAKSGKTVADLSIIKKDNGEDFENMLERERFIFEYYRDLYKKP